MSFFFLFVIIMYRWAVLSLLRIFAVDNLTNGDAMYVRLLCRVIGWFLSSDPELRDTAS